MSFSVSRLLRPPLPLSLPPALLPRTSLRNFHATAPRLTLLDSTTALLTDLHTTTGLSWGVLVPLTAITLRLFLTTPFTLYSRSKTATIIRLLPLQEARAHHHAKTLKDVMLPDAWENAVRIAATRDRIELWKRWKCQRWKLYLPMLQLPVWVLASATLRALLPTKKEGEVDTFVDFFGGVTTPPVVEGLETEGLLWFTDLTTTDSTMVLPAVFALGVLANVRFQLWANPPETQKQKRWGNALSVLAVPMFVLSAGMPTLLVSYWTASSLYSVALSVALHRWYKLPMRIRRCKSIDEVGDMVGKVTVKM
ncbi:60Kd inner membrane protein-domain-containing protein [Trichophaea hybrida]|nr:60Kd inner membrane protein-domain-containing protein [Trichophaea hybrida]